MADEIQRAEEALEAAREDHEAAQERRQRLRERIDGLEDRAHRAKTQLREAHQEEADAERLEEIRAARREASREAADLREELEIVDDVVEQKRQAVREAEMDLAELRAGLVQEEAREVAGEITEHLAGLADAVDRMEALNNTAQGLDQAFRDREAASDPESTGTAYLRDPPVKGSVWPDPLRAKRRTIRQFTGDVTRILE